MKFIEQSVDASKGGGRRKNIRVRVQPLHRVGEIVLECFGASQIHYPWSWEICELNPLCPGKSRSTDGCGEAESDASDKPEPSPDCDQLPYMAAFFSPGGCQVTPAAKPSTLGVFKTGRSDVFARSLRTAVHRCSLASLVRSVVPGGVIGLAF